MKVWKPTNGLHDRSSGHLRRRRAVAFVAFAAIASIALSACGASDTGAKDGAPTVKVAFAPISPFILPYVATSQKLDADNGVTIEPVDYTSTATEIPSVIAGDINIGVAGAADVLTAIAQGLPLKIIGNLAAVGATSSEKAVLGLVTADGSIQSAADLKGKTIGVNSLNTYNTLSATAALLAAGVSLDDIEFVKIPYASLPAAVAKKQIAAAVLQEPALSQATNAGNRLVTGLGPDLGEGSPASVYFVYTKWADSHKEELSGAIAAMRAASDAATNDESLLRSEILKVIPAPADVGDKMNLPDFSTDVPDSAWDALTEFMVKVEYIEQAPKASDYVIRP